MNDQPSGKVPFVSWVGLLGWCIFFTALGVGIFLIIFDIFPGHSNPYTGVVTYLIVPGFLTMGLSLVGLSVLLRYRYRLRYGVDPEKALVLDFTNPKHRQRLKVFAVGATLFACLSAVGSYRSYHFTESTEFCGMTCHKVMKPEYVTYHNSPHARVACVECHIGAGADWYVKSKMSGLRQVYAYTLGTYHLPIETPVHDLRPARETCEECHWPEKFTGNREKVLTHTLRDEENTPYAIRLLLKVGGKQGGESSGIHWHVSSGNKIEYISTDRERLEIPWVKMTDPQGKVTIFKTEDCDPSIPSGTRETRTMDCIDCHNRPAHIFNDPMKMVDRAIAIGKIDRSLPGIKSTVMDILEKPHYTTEEALAAIETGLKEAYLPEGEVHPATRTEAVERSREAVAKIYSNNFFPEMGVDWTTHPDYIGHFRWKGCYRCHDGNHKAESGEVISHDCNTCHLITGQGEGEEKALDLAYEVADFNHPMDMGPLEPGANCTDCHAAPPPTDYKRKAPETVHAGMN